MSKPVQITFQMVQNVVLQYEKLVKEYPQCKNLNETLDYWKEKEKEFKKWKLNIKSL